jgi:hypothetical protein
MKSQGTYCPNEDYPFVSCAGGSAIEYYLYLKVEKNSKILQCIKVNICLGVDKM